MTKKRSQDPRAHLADGILRKLEANRCVRYETVLTADELNEAILMIRAAVDCARTRMAAKRMPPRTLQWQRTGRPRKIVSGVGG